MKFFLISDNVDTKMGMRFAGIEGVVVHEAEEVRRELNKAMEDESIAVILMTSRYPTATATGAPRTASRNTFRTLSV